MADSEQELRLKVTTQADTAGVKQAARDVEDFGRKSKEASKADLDAATKGTEATKKWTRSKQQLTEVLRGLTLQFPALSRVVTAVVNPITLSFAAIAVAGQSLYKALKPIGTVLQNSSWGTEKINEAAEAWGRYAAAIAKVKTGADELNGRLGQISQRMGLIAKASSKWGESMADNPLFQRRQQEKEAGAKAEAAAAARRKADELEAQANAINVPSELEDQNTMAGLDTTDAEARKKALDAQLAELDTIGDSVGPTEIPLAWANRLGIGNRERIGPADIPEARRTLESQRDQYQRAIDARRNFERQMETNKAARAAKAGLIGKAAELRDFAGATEREAAGQVVNAQANFAAQLWSKGIYPETSPTGAGMSVTPQALDLFRKGYEEMVQLSAMWTQGIQAMRKDVEWIRNQQNTKPE